MCRRRKPHNLNQVIVDPPADRLEHKVVEDVAALTVSEVKGDRAVLARSHGSTNVPKPVEDDENYTTIV